MTTILTHAEAINALTPDARVRIWSAEHRAYWRPDAHGYTLRTDDAGEWSLEAAHELTRRCGPEKGIRFAPIDDAPATSIDGPALAAAILAIPPGYGWLLRSDGDGFFANVTSANFAAFVTDGGTVVTAGRSHRVRGPTPHGALAEAAQQARDALT